MNTHNMRIHDEKRRIQDVYTYNTATRICTGLLCRHFGRRSAYDMHIHDVNRRISDNQTYDKRTTVPPLRQKKCT